MSGGWEPGDLALCVHLRPRGMPTIAGLDKLRQGAIYTVIGITTCLGSGALSLVFDEVKSGAPHGAYWHGRFRKIAPHKADEEDAETIALLNSTPVLEPTELGREAYLMAPCIASDSREVGTTPARLPAFVRPFHSTTDSLGER